MKSQREIYEALLAGKVVVDACMHFRLDKSGNIECSLNNGRTFKKSSHDFEDYEDIEIYTQPRIPMTLEADVAWESDGFVHPTGDFIVTKLQPFIGKRTKMVLTEVIE